jgi:DNA-binding transcriptional ArsR family regulator
MNKKLDSFIKAISENNRLKILKFLDRERCVCEIWEELKLPQNLVSHHLKVLKNGKLITSRKNGVKVIYRLNKEELTKSLQLLTNYLK